MVPRVAVIRRGRATVAFQKSSMLVASRTTTRTGAAGFAARRTIDAARGGAVAVRGGAVAVRAHATTVRIERPATSFFTLVV